MYKAYKYRIYPTEVQRVLIEKHFGCVRYIYNYALGIKKRVWEEAKLNVAVRSIRKNIPGLKKDDDTAFLGEVNSQTLSAALDNLDKAYTRFLKGVKDHPRLKVKRGKQTFTSPQGNKVDFIKGLVFIGKFREGIKVRFSRVFEGKIKICSVTKTSTNKYFISIIVDVAQILPTKKLITADTSVGIDLGLKSLVMLSSGDSVENPRFFKKGFGRLVVLQRRASRKRLGSNNRKKANLRVAKLHEKISNRRLDFIHKVTSGLVSDNQTDTFFMEDLNVKVMMSNRRLSRSISDVSWGDFRRQMQYKCDWAGKNLILVDRWFPSSKTCSNCGAVKTDLTLADRTYKCTGCEFVIDRDENAALNIKNHGLKSLTGQELSVEPVELPTLVGAVKQE